MSYGGIIRKIIIILMIAIIVGAITASTAASPWKFAVLSDINYAYDSDVAANTLEFLVRDIKNQSVDLVIFPGDMIAGSDNIRDYKELLDSWKAMMKPLYDVGIPIYVIRGNHDAESFMNDNSDLWPNEFRDHEDGSIWPNEFGDHEDESIMNAHSDLWLNEFPVLKDLPSPDGGFTYSFTHKNTKFVGFDQYINHQGRMTDSWVTTQINDSASPLNFAFGHEPFFPNAYGSNGAKRSMSDDPKSRDALISALGTHHGTYLCGHDHSIYAPMYLMAEGIRYPS
jgi:hypothetical protein